LSISPLKQMIVVPLFAAMQSSYAFLRT
jgi:hypothetical protein